MRYKKKISIDEQAEKRYHGHASAHRNHGTKIAEEALMKRFFILLAVTALLTACAARQEADGRADALQARYAETAGCSARLDAAVVRETETLRYTLDVAKTEEETRVRVLAPEELAGVGATVQDDGTLRLTFDSIVLDAGSAMPGVSAVNATDIFLRAVAHGYVTERNTERFAETGDALRLCFETEQDGEKLLVTAWFDETDRPLYAEIECGGEILAYLEFTDFTFNDILTS